MAATILVGTSNWADHKPFYPDSLEKGRRQRDKLSYYARYFPMVEIDTTFYGIPKPQVAQGWVDRTPDAFRFNVKPYRSLTRHEREDGKPRRPTPEEERDFLEAIRPLRESGRLVAVHYQFPPWFKNTPASRDVIAEARERHPEDIVAIEFRHRSWFDDGAWPATEDYLRELDCTFVGVDAPQVGDATAPPHLAVTSARLCVVRFHGRNRRTWYIRDAASSRDRFDYLYSQSQLKQWVAPITAAASRGVPVHVLMNNNADNFAVANAFDMAHLLGVSLPRPPEAVLRTLRERDGALPEWVGASPAPLPWPGSDDDPDEQQLGLPLG